MLFSFLPVKVEISLYVLPSFTIERIFLDRLESQLKGKSEKGKLLAEILKKNSIPEKGFIYLFRYMGGDLTNEIKSHPISYLVNYKPNAGKLKVENGKMVNL